MARNRFVDVPDEEIEKILDLKYLREYENQLFLELYIACQEAKLGKGGTEDVNKFVVNEAENLMALTDELLNKTYEPSPGIAHIIHNPVMREILAAPFRDRVVHHWIYDKIYDFFDAHFIYDSYSCRVDKGTIFGTKRMFRHIAKVSQNYTIPVRIVKMDISGYFMSIPRRELLEETMRGVDIMYADKLDSKEYEILKFALAQVVLDDPTEGVTRIGWPDAWQGLPSNKSLFNQKKGRGLPIGNLTSQLLSNVYLDQLDRFVQFELGYKHYGRYVDDFYIVVTEEQYPQLLKDIRAIRSFLERLELELHPGKTKIYYPEQGVDFLGAVLYPGAIVPGKRVTHNFYETYNEYKMGKKDLKSLVSYKGLFTHYRNEQILQKITQEIECIR